MTDINAPSKTMIKVKFRWWRLWAIKTFKVLIPTLAALRIIRPEDDHEIAQKLASFLKKDMKLEILS
jgi:hypothetical protein